MLIKLKKIPVIVYIKTSKCPRSQRQFARETVELGSSVEPVKGVGAALAFAGFVRMSGHPPFARIFVMLGCCGHTRCCVVTKTPCCELVSFVRNGCVTVRSLSVAGLSYAHTHSLLTQPQLTACESQAVSVGKEKKRKKQARNTRGISSLSTAHSSSPHKQQHTPIHHLQHPSPSQCRASSKHHRLSAAMAAARGTSRSCECPTA